MLNMKKVCKNTYMIAKINLDSENDPNHDGILCIIM